MRVEPKQIDLSNLIIAIADLITNNSTLGDYLAAALQPYLIDEFVKVNDSDLTSGTLVNKIEADNTAHPITLSFTPKVDNSKLEVAGTLNSLATPIILNGIIQLYFVNTTITPESTYTNSGLIAKTLLQIVREKQVLPTDVGDIDGYQFDNSTGTITFNTPITENERVQIWAY